MKVTLLDHMGSDLTVVNAARVSFAKQKDKLDEYDLRLISYLATHDHWTPFAHPQISFRIQAPIFVARQWWRHQVGVARNETSRRYVDSEPVCFSPSGWRSRPEKSIKQGSGKSLPEADQATISLVYDSCTQQAVSTYRLLLAKGVAPEQARMVLPQSMETEWIETGSLAYFARACRQRMVPSAQEEVQDLAEEIASYIRPLFVTSWDALL
jgi:thymidylate synthase (FAD)